MRRDGRKPEDLRPLTIQRGFTRGPAGSVLIAAGGTRVLCTVSVEESVPEWIRNPLQGWLTAEYNMLPGSTKPRKPRERAGKVDGRTNEIQRLIGRSLRAVLDLKAIGPRTLAIDCDVIEADGGTRTASITGAFVALVDALAGLSNLERYPLSDSIAAVSVGIVKGADGEPFAAADLDYAEDSSASVDMNVVLTGGGRYVEVQGTGEKTTFSDDQLQQMLRLARLGAERLRSEQQAALGTVWPFPA